MYLPIGTGFLSGRSKVSKVDPSEDCTALGIH